MAEKVSIVTKDMGHCIKCGSSHVVVHHVFYGNANRKVSERYKCLAPLCVWHHNGSGQGVHFDRQFDLELKAYTQVKFEEAYPDEDFVKLFGKNYVAQFIQWREEHEQGNTNR